MVVVESVIAASAIGWVVTQLLNEVLKAYQRVKTERASVRKLRKLLERLEPAVGKLSSVSGEEDPAGKWLTQLRAQLETAKGIAERISRIDQVHDGIIRMMRMRDESKESKKVYQNILDLMIEASGFQWASGMDIKRILAENAKILEALHAIEEREEQLHRQIASMATRHDILHAFDEFQDFQLGFSSKISDRPSASAIPSKKRRKVSVSHVPKFEVTFGGDAIATNIRNYLLNGEYRKHVGPHGKGKLKARLNGENKKWVGLWGMGGVGKTVTASNIYHDPRIQNYFSGGIHWVTVSKEQPGPYELYKQFVERIKGRAYISQMPKDLGAAKTYLMGLLDRKRVLLILDDVWDWEDDDGHDLLEYLDLVSKEDSVILVTTRDKDVLGRVFGVCELFEIPILSDEDGWRLFSWHAFPHHRRGREVDVPHDLKDVAEEVAKECRGLPLALEVIGSTMADKRISAEQERLGLSSLHIWQRALGQLKNASFGKTDYQRLLQRLQLSVDSLQGSCLQDCFFYFAAFPEDANVYVEELVHIWVAEGLVKDDVDSPGEVEGRFLLACLVAKSMVQISPSDEDVPYCKVHDIMRDVARHNLHWDFEKKKEIEACARDCLYNPGRQQFELPKEWTKSATPSSATRLSMKSNDLRIFPVPEQFRAPNLQVLILSENASLQLISLGFVQNLCNLRVLDLSKTGIESVSGDLLRSLPTLVLLDLHECWALVEILDDINTLQSLEYMDLRGCNLLMKLPQVNQLTRLRWFAVEVPPEEDEEDVWTDEDDEDVPTGEDEVPREEDEEDVWTDDDGEDVPTGEDEVPREEEEDVWTDEDNEDTPAGEDDEYISADEEDEDRAAKEGKENGSTEDDDEDMAAEEGDEDMAAEEGDEDMAAEEDDEDIPAKHSEDALAAEIDVDVRAQEDISEYEEIDVKLMAQDTQARKTSSEVPTIMLPTNLKQLVAIGKNPASEKYTFDFSFAHALEKLTLQEMTSLPVGIENLQNLKYLHLRNCYAETVPALGKLDKLEYLKMQFFTSLGTESYGDQGAFPRLKTFEILCSDEMDRMFMFAPGTMPKIESVRIVMMRRAHLPSSIVELSSLKKLHLDFDFFKETSIPLKDLQRLFSQQDCFAHLEHLKISSNGKIIERQARQILPTSMLEKEREGLLIIKIS